MFKYLRWRTANKYCIQKEINARIPFSCLWCYINGWSDPDSQGNI